MEYTQYFERRRRHGTENEFYALKEKAPESLRDLIQNIHMEEPFGCLPNDWVYEAIYNAFEELPNYDYDLERCINDLESDPYYNQLHDWLHNSFAHNCIEEAREIGLISGESDLYQQIGRGQILAKEAIYTSVMEYINCNMEEDKEDEE